jgi:hypothetical protein
MACRAGAVGNGRKYMKALPGLQRREPACLADRKGPDESDPFVAMQ